MNAHGHASLITFDSDEPEFARGFEVGRLWTLLREYPGKRLEEYAHVANAEMLLRLADATGRTVQSEELDDGWLLVWFSVAQEDETG